MRCLIDHRKVEKPLPWEDILVEIGFGRGEFIVKLAEENPNKKVIGFEISGISIEKLLKKCRELNLYNLFCVHMDAFWGFYFLLKDSSVESIFLNFPDPWFKKKHHKRRLTSERNLNLFARKLKKGGAIRIKTDHLPFVEWTLEKAKKLDTFDINFRKVDRGEPLTKYEKKWISLGREIYALDLIKVKDPEHELDVSIKEVETLFPVELEGKEFLWERAQNLELRLSDSVILKTFRVFEGEGTWIVEALLSEEGFVQKFFFEIRKTKRGLRVDIASHSEVIRTLNLQRAVETFAEKIAEDV